jgi:flavorubredoxin
MGAHYCNEKVFNDLIASDPVELANMWDAYEYYFNAIFGPFKSSALAALNKIKDLDIKIVCCSHGPVLRSNLDEYFAKYRQWSTEAPREKIVTIAYAAAYKYTGHMAEAIKKGIEAEGYKVLLFNLLEAKKEEVMATLGASKGLLLGTPTIIGDAVPPVWAIAADLNTFIHKGLFCGTFGSFGWSGEGCKNIQQRFQQLRLKTPCEPMTLRYKPTAVGLKECEEWGSKFAKALQ